MIREEGRKKKKQFIYISSRQRGKGRKKKKKKKRKKEIYRLTCSHSALRLRASSNLLCEWWDELLVSLPFIFVAAVAFHKCLNGRETVEHVRKTLPAIQTFINPAQHKGVRRGRRSRRRRNGTSFSSSFLLLSDTYQCKRILLEYVETRNRKRDVYSTRYPRWRFIQTHMKETVALLRTTTTKDLRKE